MPKKNSTTLAREKAEEDSMKETLPVMGNPLPYTPVDTASGEEETPVEYEYEEEVSDAPEYEPFRYFEPDESDPEVDHAMSVQANLDPQPEYQVGQELNGFQVRKKQERWWVFDLKNNSTAAGPFATNLVMKLHNNEAGGVRLTDPLTGEQINLKR